MAGNTPYTGKSVGALLTVGGTAPPGWRRCVIEETAGPLPEQLDKTDADDSGYSTMEDPLGEKGSPKTTVTIEGVASKNDVDDSGLFSLALDSSQAVVCQAATGAGHDKFTATMILKRRSRPAELTTIVPYTIVLELENLGTWATSLS